MRNPGFNWILGVAVLGIFSAGSRSEVPVQPAAPRAADAPARDGGARPSDPPGHPQRLVFLNGDTLSGAMVSFNSRGGVRWQHAASKEPLAFAPSCLARIDLRKPDESRDRSPSPWLVRLLNGDELPGKPVSLDGEKVVMDTSYAGQLSIRRSMVQSLAFLQPRRAALYAGPTGLEGWKIDEEAKAWQYRDGVFSTAESAAIGRNFELPNQASIEFEAAWTGNLQLDVGLFADSLGEDNVTGYGFTLDNGSASLARAQSDNNRTDLGTIELPDLNRKSRLQVRICVNREQRSFWLFIDGVLAKQWKDPSPFPGKGSGLIFYPQGNGLFKLSHIRIEEWNGRIENESAAARPPSDTVQLWDGNRFAGKLEFLRDGKLSIATPYGALSIPVDQVARIEMGGGKIDPAKPLPGSACAVFLEQGSVTLQIEQWDGQKLSGRNAYLENAVFQPGAFQSVEFNLESRKPAEDEDELIEDDPAGEEEAVAARPIKRRHRHFR